MNQLSLLPLLPAPAPSPAVPAPAAAEAVSRRPGDRPGAPRADGRYTRAVRVSPWYPQCPEWCILGLRPRSRPAAGDLLVEAAEVGDSGCAQRVDGALGDRAGLLEFGGQVEV